LTKPTSQEEGNDEPEPYRSDDGLESRCQRKGGRRGVRLSLRGAVMALTQVVSATRAALERYRGTDGAA